MKRPYLVLACLVAATGVAAAPAAAGKKDDTLVWATERDNPIADPFYLNTRELVVIGHHVRFWRFIGSFARSFREPECRSTGTGSTAAKRRMRRTIRVPRGSADDPGRSRS
jgi:hypothetical protein